MSNFYISQSLVFESDKIIINVKGGSVIIK